MIDLIGSRAIPTPEGEILRVRDNFFGTNVAYKAVGVKRFEVVVLKPKKPKKEKK